MIRAIATLAGKDSALLWRDRAALFWVFVFPVAVAMLVAAMAGGGAPAVGALPIQVLDQDGTEASRALVKALEASPALKTVRADSMAAGAAAVRAGAAVALVAVRPGLAIELHARASRPAETAILRGLVAEALAAGADAARPIVIPVAGDAGRPRSPFETAFPIGMAWGLIGAAVSFALSLARERQAGIFLRLRAAPVSRVEILLGKAVACWLAGFAALLLLLLLGAAMFAIRPGDALGLAMSFAAASACFAGLMLLIGQFAEGEVAIALAGWVAMLVLAMFGGAIVPVHLMPEWMQAVGEASPVRWAIQAFEGPMWREQDWRAVAHPCLMLAGTGFGAFAVGVALSYRRRQ